MAYDSSGDGLHWKDEIRRTDDVNHIVSHQYQDLLENEENLELIKIPTFTARPDQDEAEMSFYTELLGNIMPVKLLRLLDRNKLPRLNRSRGSFDYFLNRGP